MKRSEKREEEKRIIEELGLAPKPVSTQKQIEKSHGKDMPEKIHCKRCKTLMENGVCPVCGYKIYMPMNEKTQKRIRWIVGGVCIVGFLILFFILR